MDLYWKVLTIYKFRNCLNSHSSPRANIEGNLVDVFDFAFMLKEKESVLEGLITVTLFACNLTEKKYLFLFSQSFILSNQKQILKISYKIL